jgi:hypothetical protein
MYNYNQNEDFTNSTLHSVVGIAGSINKYLFIAPNRCVIRKIKLVSDTTTASSDGSNKYTFQVVNLTKTLNLLSTAKTTNGAEITQHVAYNLGADQNLVIDANDIIQLQITKTGSPTSLATAALSFQIDYRSSGVYPQ